MFDEEEIMKKFQTKISHRLVKADDEAFLTTKAHKLTRKIQSVSISVISCYFVAILYFFLSLISDIRVIRGQPSLYCLPE